MAMSKPQKIITTALWAILIVVMLGVIAAGALDRFQQPPLPRLFAAPAFALVDQNEKTVSDKDLRGHPYIASFVFTHCAGPCPLVTSHIAELQKAIRDSEVHFVSFSVDPEHDTPAALKEYAGRFGADSARWHLLTGKPKDVYAVVEGMNMALQPATEKEPIIHSTKLLLIDGTGQVRGIYDGGEHWDARTLKTLTADAERLARTK
jgi:protein SCO1/2